MNYPEVYRREITGKDLKLILEDVCDNLFNPDPFYQQGGDMVRVGGMTYQCSPKNKMGTRISDMRLVSNGNLIEENKKYVVGGWGSVNEGVEGPTIYDIVEEYIKNKGIISSKKSRSIVKVLGM